MSSKSTRRRYSRFVSWMLVLAALAGVSGLCMAEEGIVILATTTSTQNSGLLDAIHPDFEAKTGLKIKVIARGTGASLQLGRQGDVDVVLAHAPELEVPFVAEGYGVERRPVMHNDFVIIGPKSDPAAIKGLTDAAKAFKQIYDASAMFVSRGDQSGTHVKEQTLWEASGVEVKRTETTAVVEGEERTFTVVAPTGDWYQSIGQGMGNAIGYATERQAYTLSDRGTYYAFALAEPPRTDLALLCEGDPRQQNPYSVIAVNPKRFPKANYDGAMKYIQWLTSSETQQRIAEFKVGGKVLFYPDAAPKADM